MDNKGKNIKSMTLRVIFSVMFVVACFLYIRATAAEKNRLVFSHKDHVELSGCKDCHGGSKGSVEPVIPDGKACVECHNDSPLEKLNLADRKKPKPLLVFSHKTHGKSDCMICHTISEKQLPGMPGFPECSKCHSNMNVKTSCGNCHNTPFTPDYHKGLWTKTHGFRAESITNKAVHGKNCALCHPEPSCVRCHQTMKPNSHTGFFRMRGHGLKASIESESCKTCHRESFCVSCHRETKPLNHKGNWEYIHGFAIPGGKGGAIGKCAVCHKASWCAACHNGNKT